MTESTRIIGSDLIPEAWNLFIDANGKTLCIVIVAPIFRVVFGDPLDDRITAAKVNRGVLARFAKSQMERGALEAWQPNGRAQ